jgi:hypothetical protein
MSALLAKARWSITTIVQTYVISRKTNLALRPSCSSCDPKILEMQSFLGEAARLWTVFFLNPVLTYLTIISQTISTPVAQMITVA